MLRVGAVDDEKAEALNGTLYHGNPVPNLFWCN